MNTADLLAVGLVLTIASTSRIAGLALLLGATLRIILAA